MEMTASAAVTVTVVERKVLVVRSTPTRTPIESPGKSTNYTVGWARIPAKINSRFGILTRGTGMNTAFLMKVCKLLICCWIS